MSPVGESTSAASSGSGLTSAVSVSGAVASATNTTQAYPGTSSPSPATSSLEGDPPSESGAPSEGAASGSSNLGTGSSHESETSTAEASSSLVTSQSSENAPMSAPPVDLPAGVSGMFPLPDAIGVCPDPTLHLHFSGKPQLGTTGKISVYEANNPNSPAARIDLAVATTSDVIGGATFNVPKGAYVDGNEVIFTLPSKGLGYGKTYYVQIDAGAVRGPDGSPFTITDDSTWRFATADRAPAEFEQLRVALDGDGQFCTLQGAVDAARDGTSISIGAGNYYGIVYFENKNNLTMRGDDRAKTALKGVNNNNLNPSTRGRSLVGTEGLTQFTVENLTIHNLTPQDGSQAEALTLLDCDRCLVRDANILSLQDTLLWSGKIYADNCYIAGNVDYIWGTGAAYFNQCEIRTVGRNGYNVQARNGSNAHGYVFVDSKLTSDPGITGDVLARIDVSQYPGSEVAYIDCEIGSHISAAGWLISGGSAPASLRFLEYKSRAADGSLLNTAQRLAGSRQLSDSEAATYRDPAQILGGWTPPARSPTTP